MIDRAGSGCHSQMIELWRSLLNLIDARRLTEHQVLVARQYLVRHWNAPARHACARTAIQPSSRHFLAGPKAPSSARPSIDTMRLA